MATEYLSELVSIWKSSRKLKSSSQILLQVPLCWLKSYDDCVFSIAAAPTLLNRLARILVRRLLKIKIRSKTHLFKLLIIIV